MPPVWLEGRAWLEFAQLMRDPVFAGDGMPPGRGRPVMLIPGFHRRRPLSRTRCEAALKRAG